MCSPLESPLDDFPGDLELLHLFGILRRGDVQRVGFCGPFAPICRMRGSRFLTSSKVSWNDSLEDFRVHIEWSGTSTEIFKMNTSQSWCTYIQSR